MRFILYTDKTIPQSIQAINERLQGGGKLQGRTEKGNPHFSISTSTKVLTRSRSTRLQGTLSREDGVTVIQGYVSEGMETGRWLLVFVGVLILAFIFFITNNAILAILTALVGTWSYIPLTGDAHNSDTLLRELKRTLGAKDSKPKPESASSSSAARSNASPRPAANPSPFGSARTSSPINRPSSPGNPTGKTNPPRK
jgi:hypothetical protein